ncbi:hypothetical protein WDA38_18215, partial [Acinetobacter pittii]
MTVQVTDRLSQLYVGNGVNTRFDFTFRIFDQEDEIGVAVRIKVGNEFEFLDETKYTVTINPDNLGGYVNFLDAPNPQTYFYIAGKTPVDQQLDITNYDNFYPDAIEKALDKLTAILQEWKHLVDFETQARILADLNYDELAQQRETELKAYIDGIASAITGQPVLGLPAKFVVDGAETQKAINDLNIQVVKSKSALEVLKPRIDGQVVLMTGYYENQFQGGDHFKYDKSQSTVNNGVTIINGWVKQFSNTELTVSACGARQGNYDHTAALQLAVSTATSLKRKLIADIDLRVSASTDLSATLNIEGNGGAVQYSRSITAIADVPIFNVKAGFSSESSRFASLMFKASTGGTATAFRSTDNGYLSQCTFDHCVFDRSLRYGIDANI